MYSKIAWQWTIFFHKRRVIWHSNFVIIVIMRLFTDEGILELSQCAVSNAYTQFRRCHLKLFNFQFLGAWFKWYWPLKGILPASFVHRHSVQTWVFFNCDTYCQLWQYIYIILCIYSYGYKSTNGWCFPAFERANGFFVTINLLLINKRKALIHGDWEGCVRSQMSRA